MWRCWSTRIRGWRIQLLSVIICQKTGRERVLTGNQHSASTHSSQNLDTGPLLPAISSTIVQGVDQFRGEDDREPPDHNSLHVQSSLLDPLCAEDDCLGDGNA